MSFKFSFSGDDIIDSDSEEIQDVKTSSQTTNESVNDEYSVRSEKADGIPPQLHTLESMISTVPPHITYSTLDILLSSSRIISIPRRELFDVKMQLMAEDTGEFTAAFTEEDIRTNLYEGGLKSWECSIDLVKELASSEMSVSKIIELGCGTALPSLFCLGQVLRTASDDKDTSEHPKHFTFADYNYEVLRLVTLPNVLLSYLHTKGLLTETASDVDITAEILTEFTQTLTNLNVTLDFISGSWGQSMINILPLKGNTGYDLALASETIYSPVTMPAFAATLKACFGKEVAKDCKALVAAKTVYFGVGGTVSDFTKELERIGCLWNTTQDDKHVGVGRVIGEVTRISQ